MKLYIMLSDQYALDAYLIYVAFNKFIAHTVTHIKHRAKSMIY